MPSRRPPQKTVLVVAANLLVGALHFITGPDYAGPFPVFVNSFLIDILLPFALYFLLCLPEHPLLERWYVKAGLVFSIGLAVETAQYFGAPIFGSTFDPLDYIMYAAGVLLAAALDTLVLPRAFKFWRPESERNQPSPG